MTAQAFSSTGVSELEQLAQEIASKTQEFTEALHRHGCALPSHDPRAPRNDALPAAAASLQSNLMELTTELQTLVLGPRLHVHNQILAVSRGSSLPSLSPNPPHLFRLTTRGTTTLTKTFEKAHQSSQSTRHLQVQAPNPGPGGRQHQLLGAGREDPSGRGRRPPHRTVRHHQAHIQRGGWRRGARPLCHVQDARRVAHDDGLDRHGLRGDVAGRDAGSSCAGEMAQIPRAATLGKSDLTALLEYCKMSSLSSPSVAGH